MKYTVKIADKSFVVEIEDIHARPVIAHVEGERFEVHPETSPNPKVAKETKKFNLQEAPRLSTHLPGSSDELTAPLPGTVVDIFVKNGEEIETGNVVLIIEAMKMKNSIRSTRPGKVAEIFVSVGQSVAHKQALVRFE